MAQIDINDLTEDDPNEEGKRRLDEEKVRRVIGEHGVGSVLNYIQGRPFKPKEMREVVVHIQQVAKNYSRPPVIYGLDSVHGANYVHGAMVLPQPLNLGASYNRSIAYRAGIFASRDTRSAGINWIFSPLVGIAIDPRWSRVYETFGEDPALVAAMSTNVIRGIQFDSQDGGIPSKAAACAKHFVGYSAPHDGHDRSPSWIPTRHLYQYFVPPWQAAVDENVLTVMEDYTEVDGVPNVADKFTLRYLLRERLQFDGVLVTDYEEILNLMNWHKVTSSVQESVVHTLREGSVDMSMIPHDDMGFFNSINDGIKNERLVEERIRESVERVLKLKNELRMFDEELVMEDPNLEKVGQGQEEALQMATESIILVKNEKKTLPLGTTTSPKILVTGPTSNSLVYQSGGWTGEWQGVPTDSTEKYFTYGSTVVDALKRLYKDAKYACGVDILGNDCKDSSEDKLGKGDGVLDQVGDAYGKVMDWAGLGNGGPSNSMERAAAMAEQSEIVVICIGEEAYAEKPGDIRTMDLPSGQYELVSFIKSKTQAKIVLVYFGGRPRLLRQVVDYADAILIGFLPGPSGGEAIANLIAGEDNPSGKLPITYPMYEDGGGSPYFHTVSDQCTKGPDNSPLPHYDYVQCEVQWPFGFGLSYTTFEYSQLSLSTKTIQYQPGQAKSEAFAVSVNVKNKGTMAGAETVLFFTFDVARSTTPEYKRLRAFEKVFLEPNEEKTVSASIQIGSLKFIGPHDDTHQILENGLQFQIGVGAKTDCRIDGENAALCSDFLTIDAGEDYVAACDAACDLWERSGCSQISRKKCLDMCTGVSKNPDVAKHLGEGEDGWGWNYVKCLEPIVWELQKLDRTKQQNECGKMTTLCRDIFKTEGIDAYGHGADLPYSGKTAQFTSVFVALTTGLLASVLVYFTLKGKFQNQQERRGSSGIQFTRVSDEEGLTV